MIDIHCHILYGVDDGAKSLEESIEMAKIAQSEGIKIIINTSHLNPSFDYIVGDSILNKLENFNKVLEENNIDVKVLIGNEVYYSNDLLEYMDKKEFFTLNNSRYLLLEFTFTAFPKNLSDIIYEIKLRGYIPILAHVERYHNIQEDLGIIDKAIYEGAFIQVNASTVLGRGTKKANKVCDILLRENKVHFIATDAHGSNNRRPMMREAYEYVLNKYGKSRANRLFLSNPSCVINNEDIVFIEDDLEIVPKKRFLDKLFKRR